MQRDRVRHYRIHGVPATVTSDRTPILDAIHRRLRYFASDPGDSPRLRIDFRIVSAPAKHVVREPAGATRLLLHARMERLPMEAVYSDAEDVLWVRWGDAIRMRVDSARGSVTVSVVDDHAGRTWLLSHPVLTIALIEVLRRHGLYNLHAAGLSFGGTGLLVAGASGAGKSTLALALARAGFGFLADDTVFLTGVGSTVAVLAFPDEVDITNQTAALFPELHRLVDGGLQPAHGKHGVFIDEVWAVEMPERCVPAVVVLPRVAHAATSVLKEIGPEELFVELVPNVLITDRATGQAHLDMLARLARQTRSYRLETGRDLDGVVARLRDVLSCEGR